MATKGETRNRTFSMPGRKPSFSRSIGQSLNAALGRKDGFYFEIEFLSDTPSYNVGEKKQILVDYVEIGRSSNCAVRYKGEGIEAKVSGKHISITRNGGEWTLEHLSKTNSTIINGSGRIIRPDDSFKKYVLQDGDSIQLAKGGPTIRFVVPKENNLQSLRSRTRGSTFVRNIVSQAVAPLKSKIRVLLSTLAIVIAGFIVYAIISHNKMSEQLQTIANLQKTIDNIDHIPDSVFVVQRDTVIINNRRVTVDEDRSMLTLAQNQNVKNDVYKIFYDSVVFTGPENMHATIPVGGSGSGFLLSDGRFVTARHCVELWIYSPSMIVGNNQEAASYLCAASMFDECKFTSYFHSVSPNGQVLYFSSDQFKCDHSADIKVLMKDDSGTPIVTEDGTQIFYYAPSNNKLGLDWAYTTSTQGKRGSIEADNELSGILQTGRKLLVVGFPLGYAGDSNEPISNDQPYILDPPYSHGCFVHSGGTDHGNSGGPIFANKNGKLVVVGLVSQGGSNHNLAVPMKNIH